MKRTEECLLRLFWVSNLRNSLRWKGAKPLMAPTECTCNHRTRTWTDMDTIKEGEEETKLLTVPRLERYALNGNLSVSFLVFSLGSTSTFLLSLSSSPSSPRFHSSAISPSPLTSLGWVNHEKEISRITKKKKNKKLPQPKAPPAVNSAFDYLSQVKQKCPPSVTGELFRVLRDYKSARYPTGFHVYFARF